MSVVEPLNFISTALAPVVALSACAILTSNAQTQYSSLLDRLRALNEERRNYQGDEPLTDVQALRLKSLNHQIPVFFRRARHLRNAMFMLFLGMMFILLTSFMIVSTATFRWELLSIASKWCFFGGLLFVFLALVALLREVLLTFPVVRYELGIFDPPAGREVERGFKIF